MPFMHILIHKNGLLVRLLLVMSSCFWMNYLAILFWRFGITEPCVYSKGTVGFHRKQIVAEIPIIY